MSIINYPGLSDNDRNYLRDGIIERMADIVNEQAEQLVERMATLKMEVWYKVQEQYGKVELIVVCQRHDAEETTLVRTYSPEIMGSRSYVIGVVQRDLEIMVRTLFFS